MIKSLIRSMTALLVAILPATAQETSTPTLQANAIPAVLEKAVDRFIRPGYRDFRDRAGDFEDAMQALCATPSQEQLTAARDTFVKTVEAWSKIEIVRVGPAIEANRFERILFYPDRKSTGLKQVQALLANPDESATRAETLREKSVAMQGLGAAEFVLYGTDFELLLREPNGFRCRYGAAIAGNLEHLGSELAAEWDEPSGVQDAWKHPGADNAYFRDNREAMTALLGILVHGAEAVRDQRIETFYKGEDAKTLPRQAIFWRSGLTFASIRGNFEGMRTLIDQSDMQELLDPGSRSIVTSIDFVLKSLIRTAGAVSPDVETAVTSPEERSRLDFLLLNGKDLILRLNDDFGGALGLGAGFSFSDGD
nr:imelysin family protein [Ciceribacter thiooxidans]